MGPARPRTGRRGGRRPGGLGGLRRGRHAGDLHDPGDRPARPGGAGGPGSRASGLLTGGAATSVWRGTEVAARPSGCLHGRVTASDTHRAVEAVWRIGAARLIAALSGIVRDAAQAQALAQDALVAALEQWPREGVPRNPGAWLMTVAKRRAVDLIRRNRTYERKLAELGRDLEDRLEDDEPPEAGEIEDDLLRLVFTACHPVLPAEARVALTLRVLGGLSTGEIARAFLMSEPAVAQRIVRAKRTLAARKVPFEVPSGMELAERLSPVLEVIYLIFNEGYSATAGDDWMRPALCEDALRLGRVLAGLMPKEPEVFGLVALMEI